MAEHTVTPLVLKPKQNVGQSRRWKLSLNITAAGVDGYSITAGTNPLSGWERIEGFRVLGQENGGYVMQYIPTTLPASDGYMGNGKVRVYEAGGDGGVLDEVVSGDLGVFIVEIEGK